MQHRRAFALRDSLDAETFGGSVAMPDGTTFRVDDALAETGGMIVTGDPALIGVLSEYNALKQVPVPEEHAGYDGMKVAELDALIAERGISVPEGAVKADKVAALYADDQADEGSTTDAAAAEASIVNAEGGEGSDS